MVIKKEKKYFKALNVHITAMQNTDFRPIKSRFTISKELSDISRPTISGLTSLNSRNRNNLLQISKENINSAQKKTPTKEKPRRRSFCVETQHNEIKNIDEDNDDIVLEGIMDSIVDNISVNSDPEVVSSLSFSIESNEVKIEEPSSNEQQINENALDILLKAINEIFEKISNGTIDYRLSSVSNFEILERLMLSFADVIDQNFIQKQTERINQILMSFNHYAKVYLSFMESSFTESVEERDISNFDQILKIGHLLMTKFKQDTIIDAVITCFQSSNKQIRKKAFQFIVSIMNHQNLQKILFILGRRLTLIPSFGITESLQLIKYVFEQNEFKSAKISNKLMNCIVYGICAIHRAPHYLTFKEKLIETELLISGINPLCMYFFRKFTIDCFPKLDCFRTTIFYDELVQLFLYPIEINESMWNRVVSHISSHHPLVVVNTMMFISKTNKTGMTKNFDFKNVVNSLQQNISSHWNSEIRQQSVNFLSDLNSAGFYSSESSSPEAVKKWKKIAQLAETEINVPFRSKIEKPDIETDRKALIEALSTMNTSNFNENLSKIKLILTNHCYKHDLVRVVHAMIPRMISSPHSRQFAHKVAALSCFKGSNVLKNTTELLIGFLFEGSQEEKKEARLCLQEFHPSVEINIMKMIISRIRSSITSNADDVALYLSLLVPKHKGIFTPADLILLLPHCNENLDIVAQALSVIESYLIIN